MTTTPINHGVRRREARKTARAERDERVRRNGTGTTKPFMRMRLATNRAIFRRRHHESYSSHGSGMFHKSTYDRGHERRRGRIAAASRRGNRTR